MALGRLEKRILRLLESVKIPLSIWAIAYSLNLTRNEAQAHLAPLCRYGYVREIDEGFLVTEKGREIVRPTISREKAKKALSPVPPEKSFYFYLELDHYTGNKASDLAEFCNIIKTVDIKSIEFHLGRNDFEKWIETTLGDKKLANEIARVRKLGIRGSKLREELYKILRTHYNWLKRIAQE